MTYNLLAISGSLRKGSYNTALLRAWKSLAHERVNIDIVVPEDMQGFASLNQDHEDPLPEYVVKLKERIKNADGVLISTPEYNRSVPGWFKNVIDWTSRPTGDLPWKGKPVFIMGASNGMLGTVSAQHDLKKTMLYFGARVVGQPEFYCGRAQDKFDSEGNLTDEKTKEVIMSALTAFETFIAMK